MSTAARILISILTVFLVVSVTSAHAAFVQLTWNADSKSRISGHRIYRGTRPHKYDRVVYDGTKTNCTVYQLQACRPYYFAATSYNSYGESGYSNEIFYVPRVAGDPDPDADGIADSCEENTYGTNPDRADSDGDGLKDGVELRFWQDRWDDDADGDGKINLLDWDADGDGFSDGEERAGGFDPGDPNSKPGLLPLEIGEVDVDDDWTWVAFERRFKAPVVVAGGLSCNGVEPAVVRIRNVTQKGFEIRVQEWDYLDGKHAIESIGYAVIEAGVYQLPGGIEIEAAKFETNSTDRFDSFSFRHRFKAPPVVIASVTSFEGAQTVALRLQRISRNGFDLRMQEQELNPQYHTFEQISYLAWVPSAGSFDGFTFEVGRTPNAMTHKDFSIRFSEPFAQIPVFLIGLQTNNGGNTCSVRWKDRWEKGVKAMVSEERSRDSETWHYPEVGGYMVFSYEW